MEPPTATQLCLTPLTGIPYIKAGDDLTKILLQALEKTGITLEDGHILVLAQKIVSKAEGRYVDLTTVTPSQDARKLAAKTDKDPRLVTLILEESNQVIRTRQELIIVEHRLGFICANAGIDHSNVGLPEQEPGEWVLLLPENPDESARIIRKTIEKETGVRIGVQIIDSHGRAWRLGVVGITIGLSGIPGLVNMRGRPDLFGYNLRVTEIGAADELAAAASLVMGQAAEGVPAVHVSGFPYPLREAAMRELLRPPELDLFR
jgi:coenzyme F420-0:L-glutamate ligase/coenzyme F420-1:gamma-L-glutamate ligase